MGKVIIHHPKLTAEERAYRMEEIKKAVIQFHKEVLKNEAKSKDIH